MVIRIKVLEHDVEAGTSRALVKVESRGRVYACTYADGEKMAAELTEADIRRDWKENRRAFLPYDEVNGCYV